MAKKGLPHIHILVWLENKIHASEIDSIISAEIPDPNIDPELFDIIIKNMVHGPCGNDNPNSPCMQNGRCTKKYPKKFVNETQTGEDSYPLYRRRKPENGLFETNKVVGNVTYNINNSNIVPYSPILSKMFKCHINVEWCNSIKSIKYVCKYIHKGSDLAMFVIQIKNRFDEIENYQKARYIQSTEAAHRILGFPLHEHSPPVQQLSVHLENGQRVYFREENVENIAQLPAPRTTLTAFFELCRQDQFARTLLYKEVNHYYTWNSTNKRWSRRVRGEQIPGNPQIRYSNALGRIYVVHPNNAECFYLRILLLNVRGPTSFENLRTVSGEIQTTYRLACSKLRLIENDNHWKDTLKEASETASAHKLRDLFAIMLI